MYVKRYVVSRGAKRYAYLRLVESYRDERGAAGAEGGAGDAPKRRPPRPRAGRVRPRRGGSARRGLAGRDRTLRGRRGSPPPRPDRAPGRGRLRAFGARRQGLGAERRRPAGARAGGGHRRGRPPLCAPPARRRIRARLPRRRARTTVRAAAAGAGRLRRLRARQLKDAARRRPGRAPLPLPAAREHRLCPPLPGRGRPRRLAPAALRLAARAATPSREAHALPGNAALVGADRLGNRPAPPLPGRLYLVLGGGAQRRRGPRAGAPHGRGRARTRPARPRWTPLPDAQAGGGEGGAGGAAGAGLAPGRDGHAQRQANAPLLTQRGGDRRHRDLKGPLRVRPIFLQNDERIEALLSIVGLALLVFGLIEAELRRALGDGELPGLLPEGRAARPTGSNIFAAFQGLALTYTPAGIALDRLTATQRRILRLLQVTTPWPEQGR